MISKELLSVVMGVEIYKIIILDNYIRYTLMEDYEDIAQDLYEINIFELAHKCKEWAYKQGFLIGSNCRNGVTVTDINTHTILNHFDVDFEDFTEFEIKACQWLLDN